MASNSMVCHRWANEQVSERGLRSGHIIATPETIYSYGSHFPMARHVRNKRGDHVVLVTTRRHSVTTTAHIGRVRSAIPQSVAVFEVGNVMACATHEHRANLDAMREQIASLTLKARRARVNTRWHLEGAMKVREQGIAYARYFGLRWTPPDMEKEADQLQAKMRRQRTQLAERERKQQAERFRLDAEARVRDAGEFAEWQRGERTYCPYSYRYAEGGSAQLRRLSGSGRGDILETSLGAEVPWEHAVRAYRIVKRYVERGTPWRSNGSEIRVGHFKLDSITGEGTIRAGCHVFTWPIVSAFFSGQGAD